MDCSLRGIVGQDRAIVEKRMSVCSVTSHTRTWPGITEPAAAKLATTSPRRTDVPCWSRYRSAGPKPPRWRCCREPSSRWRCAIGGPATQCFQLPWFRPASAVNGAHAISGETGMIAPVMSACRSFGDTRRRGRRRARTLCQAVEYRWVYGCIQTFKSMISRSYERATGSQPLFGNTGGNNLQIS